MIGMLGLGLMLTACGSSDGDRRLGRVSTPSATRTSEAGPAVPQLILQPVSFRDLPAWETERQGEALEAFQRSCQKLMGLPAEQNVGGHPWFGRAGHWQEICARVGYIADDISARRFFEAWFVPYRTSNGNDERGLFTGYYEPLLRGSWVRTPVFRVPIYRLPAEAATKGQVNGANGGILPSRGAIEAGALAGRGLELLWVDDAVDAFFLHIQGSGQVEMPDGRRVRLAYAGKNGHPYFAIGAELVRRGEVSREAMSMSAIRSWLAANPAEGRRLMAMNASFVFFRVIEGNGPIGAQGVPLSPGRSMAVDPAFVAYGVPIWLDTTDPLLGNAPLQRLVVAQDTGGAIKGPVRGDLFWGSGAAAGTGAGLMKQEGRWFLLLPRAAAVSS